MIHLTTEQLRRFEESGEKIPVINVLDPEDYREAHIPKSKNIPFNSGNFLEEVRTVVGSKEDPVVVYCASESCPLSEKAAAELENAGFTKVYEYDGGTKAWKEAGEPIATGKR